MENFKVISIGVIMLGAFLHLSGGVYLEDIMLR